MAKSNVDILARDLARLLMELRGLHAELAMHMRNKLDAIKRADSRQIEAITAREMVLAGRVEDREGLRRLLTRQIVAGLGRPDLDARTLRLRDLAEYFSEPRRSQLLVAAAGLREKLNELERMRVASTLITREMLKHLQEVLSVMTAGGPAVDSYSRSGRRERTGPACVFEAVG